MAREKGKLVYMVYRAMTYSLSPFLYLHLHWRRLRGLEHPLRWPERLGRPSLPRPSGPLLWFHAVSLGEGMAAIPVIKQCVQKQPQFTILMTTTTTSAFNVIKDLLPTDVIYQFAPLDTPVAMDSFLGYWSPNAIMLMESELWPNLILGASRKGIILALLNARISSKSFKLWSGPVALPLISLMLSKFSLIAPLSTQEAIRFQLLHAPPSVISFPGDLKYAVGDDDVPGKESICIKDLQRQLANRPVWMASSVHDGEEEVMLEVHKELLQIYPDAVMIIVPRHPERGKEFTQALQKEGFDVVLRSRDERISPSSNIYVADTLGELRSLYQIMPIAVIGGSFLPGLAGHNISEAAAAGCAVLTGYHVGHFSHMVFAMQQANAFSVRQVSEKRELVEALTELLSDCSALEARRVAAKQAFLALSCGIVGNVWNLVHLHVIIKILSSITI
ncbi:3-deoxy-D-manno-octulosonic acid transferase [Thalictrum thalictroides]|uniref:lipid IVA 3-deoxy-D-manno-octulosonic acid transferase n=1 Tax=Thalictrum thalictroides TaxID=46969 RepID=A0A7J6WDH1_THATH|nr:3-deoxy-D-manno-octulosonic acid transferase [Thalictrum thalictroides]